MTIRVLAVSLVLGTLAVGSAVASTFTSRIIAHDPATHRIVLEDKSIVTYDKNTKFSQPVTVGDRIKVDFTGAEGALDKIVAITVLEAAQ